MREFVIIIPQTKEALVPAIVTVLITLAILVQGANMLVVAVLR